MFKCVKPNYTFIYKILAASCSAGLRNGGDILCIELSLREKINRVKIT